MANDAPAKLIDYIHWRGDLEFDRDPLNDTDNIILCQLSYLDCSAVLPQMDQNGRLLKDVYQDIRNRNCYRMLTVTGGGEDFVAEAAASKRFGNLRMTNYLDEFDKTRTQFAAMHFELDEGTSYIAFRGTDNSIIGWREDFMTSFTPSTGQKMAHDYLNRTMNQKRNYFIGGHSKGGNHAVFAASCLTPEMQNRILRIFNNDGPGFCPDVFDISKIDAIRGKITKIVPSYDVIGQLFSRNVPDTKIIESSYPGVLQHDAVSWCVDGPNLKTAASLDPGVKLINETFEKWIEKANQMERKAFVESLFDGLESKGAVTLDQVQFKDIMDSLHSMISSTETSRILLELPKTYFSTATKHAAEAFEQFAEEKLKQLSEKEAEKEKKKEMKVKK